MQTILDTLNKLREEQGLPPLEAPQGYTNENDFGSLAGSFGIGAGRMINDVALGGGGATLGNLGRLVEKISPFSGYQHQNAITNLLKAEVPFSEVMKLFPYMGYEDSWLTSGAKKALTAHNAVEDEFNNMRTQLLGTNPTPLAHDFEGAGTSFGFMGSALGLGYLFGGSPLALILSHGGSEAAAEAGNFLGDVYRQGLYDKGIDDGSSGAIAVTDKVFGTNLALNTALDSTLGYLARLGPLAKLTKTSTPGLKRYLIGSGGSLLNELLQEPSQEIISEAGMNSLINGTSFTSELMNSGKHWWDTARQLAPSVSTSTLITQGLLGGLEFAGIPTGVGLRFDINQNAENKHEVQQLQDERVRILQQINNTNNPDEVTNLIGGLLDINEKLTRHGITPEIEEEGNEENNNPTIIPAGMSDIGAQNFSNQESARLQEERDKVAAQINNYRGNNPEEIQQMQLHLANLDEAVKNYGKTPEQIQNERIAEQSTPVTPVEQTYTPLPDDMLKALEEQKSRIEESINSKLIEQNNKGSNPKNQEELVNLFSELNRIDTAIKEGNVSEATQIINEANQQNGYNFDIENASLNELQTELNRLENLTDEKLEEQIVYASDPRKSSKLEEEILELTEHIGKIQETIKNKQNENANDIQLTPSSENEIKQNNTPSMDDIWNIAENNEDTNDYYDDYDNYDNEHNTEENLNRAGRQENNAIEELEKINSQKIFDIVNRLNLPANKDFDRKSYAEALSKVITAQNMWFAKYTGQKISNNNIEFRYVHGLRDEKGNQVKANIAFDPNIEDDVRAIIRVSEMADASSILHETGHWFLKKLEVLYNSGQLKGLAKKDWQILLNAYKVDIGNIDFNNMSEADGAAWKEFHEKFATDLERYFRTGEAPSNKLKHVFEQFKRWLKAVYTEITNIRYAGADGQMHSLELHPDVKAFFDEVFGDNEQGNRTENHSQTANKTIGKKKTIHDVIEAVKTEQGIKNSGSIWCDYARISPNEAKRISEATGLDINDNYVHTFVGSSLIHTNKRHGLGNEKIESQLPITENDYEQIPNVIQNADEITLGNEKTSLGNDTIVYQKRINGHVLIVEEVRTGRKKLSFHTMRKAKAGYKYDLSHEGHPIIREKTKSEGVTSKNDTQPEVGSPNALSFSQSLTETSEKIKQDINQIESYNQAETYNQIIGVEGAKAIDKANGNTNLMDNLEIAKQMARDGGKGIKTIWLATGWELAPDNKWRCEILDDKINKEIVKTAKKENKRTPYLMYYTKLGEVYNNKELFKAYPQLENMPVYFDGQMEDNMGGYYSNFLKEIHVNSNKKDKEIQSSLIHEIQHAVQYIEGFSKGGSSEYFESKVRQYNERSINIHNEIANLDTKAGISKLRTKLTRKVVNGTISLDEAENEIEKARKNSLLADEYQKLQGELDELRKEFDDKYHGYTNSYDIYRHLGGEVEARNVQNREKLNPKQRKNKSLTETQDVDDWIVSYNQAVAADDEHINAEEQIEAVRNQYEGTDKWLKAPNGKKSNLNEKQWLQVRTENFKRWFGDWEAATEAANPRTVNSITEAGELVRSLGILNKEIENSHLGITAQISGKGLAKMQSEKATKKSITPKLHALAVANIDRLFKSATMEFKHSDSHGRSEVEQVRRLGSIMLDNETGKYVPIMLTLIEYQHDGKKIYSVEAVDVVKYKENSAGQLTAPAQGRIQVPIAEFVSNIAKFAESVNNVSKVVDENGEPLVVEKDGELVYMKNDKQIKSATDNKGTFDANNPEIYSQAAYNPKKFLGDLFEKLRDKVKNITSSARAMNNNSKPSFETFEGKDGEIESRYKEGQKGIQQPTLTQRIMKPTVKLLRSFRGAYSDLSGLDSQGKDLRKAKGMFETLHNKRAYKVHEAMKTFTQNLKGLSEYQRDLFSRMRLLDDLTWRKSQVPDANLPFGFTDEILKKEHKRFSELVKLHPEVQKAIELEEQTIQNINKEFIAAAKDIGLDLDTVFKNPHYYRHTILEYANAAYHGNFNRADLGTIQDLVDAELNGITNRSYMKKYRGSSKDINANYVQANAEVRAQMLMDIEILKTLKDIQKEFDIAPKLRDKIRQAFNQSNNSFNQGEGINLSDVIPEGYSIFNPAGSRLIHSANSTAENIIAMALDDASESSGIPLDTILQSMGKKGEEYFNQLMVLPNQVVENLKKMSKGRDRGMLGNAARTLTSWWKKAVLYSPTRNLRYNFRNITGDIDALIAGNPGALRQFGKAFKELTKYYRGGEATQDLQDFIERSGGMRIESMNMSSSELTKLQNLIEEINKSENRSIPKRGWDLIRQFFARERAFTEWREQLLRYSAYLDYKQQMDENNGTPKTWGASIQEEVMALDDVKDRAYKMSNELLGDYQNISDVGKQLREFAIPFYSWMEANARRYYRIMKNGFTGKNSSDFTKRFMLAQGAKVPFYALSAAETFGKIALFTMLVQAFNRAVFPEEDNELPEDVKFRPHLTLGKWGGDIHYFDRIGALTDLGDWFSLDSIFLDAKQMLNGQQTLGGYMKKMAQAPVNKAINSLNPLITMPIELATGRNMYPDIFHTRTIKDSGMHVASSVGLTWPYKAITGQPRNDWNEALNLLLYSVDPDEAAYFQTLDKVRQFQERVLDKHFDGFATTKRGEVLRKLKMAMRYKDKAAIKQYMREYKQLDGTDKGLKTSMKAMDPLHGLTQDEKKKFMKWISADDRKYLRKAQKYYKQLAGKYLR